MGTVIKSGASTAGNANVDSDFNVQGNLPYTTPAGVQQGGGDNKAGFVALLSEVDKGTITGVREVKALEVTSNFRLRVAIDQLLFNEYFPGTALNTSKWTSPVATSTVAIAGNVLTINNAASLVSGAVARVGTYKYFPIIGSAPLYGSSNVQFSAVPVTNMVHEWGFYIASGVTAPTDGAYFTINAAGEFRCVVNTNGTINQSVPLDFNTLVGVNSTKVFLICLSSDTVTFKINNVKVFEAKISSVSALGVQTGISELPYTFRSYNANTVTGTASLMKISHLDVFLAEAISGKPWAHIQAGQGDFAYQGFTGSTLGTTALYSNSLISGAGVTLTNTTAPAGSGLGGQFTVQPLLAVGTDGILASFQVPAGTVLVQGKTLYITAVYVQGLVTTVLAGNATPVAYAYSLAFGHTSVSLATAVSGASKAPVRIPLGFETYVAAAPISTLGQGVSRVFNTPIVVNQGEFIQVVAKNLGAVTTSGAITFLVTFDGYWE